MVVVAVVAVLGYLGQGRHVIHVRPGGAVFDDRVLPFFFALFLVGALVALKWPLVGGLVATFTVAGLLPFAITQLEPWSAIVMVIVFASPAVVWLYLGLVHRAPSRGPDSGTSTAEESNGAGRSELHPQLGRRRVLLTMAGVVVAAVAGTALGRRVYDSIWGPTHPASSAPELPSSGLEWFWSGAVTTSSAVVRAKPRAEFGRARLLVGVTADLAGAEAIDSDNVFDQVIDFRLSGLTPDTQYFYGVELDGQLDSVRTGSFRSFFESRQSVRMVFASCARVGSNGKVFDAIREHEPAVYVCLGDFHYGDNFVDDVDDYREVLDVQLTRPAQAALYASVPIAYVWDDHDYGPNDSHRDVASRSAAMLAYREYVPHYEVAGPETAIYQAFTIGTIRVILTDARSARDPHEVPDTADKSMLGVEQRRWFLEQLTESSATHDLVIWVNPVPWVDAPAEGGDSWSGYTHERALIAEHIASNGIDNLLMVAGDAHMVAIDDGTHTNYSSVPGPGFPLIHVAALDRPGSTKGGPYTQGPIAGGGHFGVVDVEPTGDGLQVDLAAVDWRGERLLSHRFDVPFGR